MLAVGLLPFHSGGSQAYPGAYIINEGHILCQDARVWSLLEEPAAPRRRALSAQNCHAGNTTLTSSLFLQQQCTEIAEEQPRTPVLSFHDLFLPAMLAVASTFDIYSV